MTGCMFIDLSGESLDEGKMTVMRGYEEATYHVDINTTVDESLNELMTDKANIDLMLEELDFLASIEEDEEYEMLKHHINGQIKRNELFSDCNEILISGSIEEIAAYISKNEFLKGKDIQIAGKLELDDNTLKRLKDAFGNDSKIKINIEGNEETISISDYERTVIAIDEIVNKIKTYNYSPFEALMHAYDLIRDRFYVREDENDNYSVSRDLTSVLLGNKIVCVGFANIFNVVANKLGVNSNVFIISSKKSGHARNLMYVNDEKYNINGLYFFDPTFDCKRDEENNFLLGYKYFCKTQEQIDALTGGNFSYNSYECFDYEVLEELFEFMDDGRVPVHELSGFIRDSRINYILRLLGLETVEPSERPYTKEELMELLEKIIIIADRPIKPEAFIKALYNVRRNQYYENPTKYLFDIDVLTDILINSKLYVEETAEERLLAALGVRNYLGGQRAREKVEQFVRENDKEIDLEKVKLTRLLKTYLDAKSSEEKKVL